MKLYREMDVAQSLYDTPAVREAMVLAYSGQGQQACWKIDKYLESGPDPELAIFALRETIEWKAQLGMVEEAAQDSQRCSRWAVSLWGDLDERTLVVRGTELYRLGKAGLIRQALIAAESLLDDARMSLEPKDELLSAIRNNSARIYDEAGQTDRALEIYSELLDDFDRWGQAKTDAALSTRDNYAKLLLENGQPGRCQEVLRHQILLLTDLVGVSSVSTLEARHEAANVAMMNGDRNAAIEQWESLASDCERYLESAHPLTCQVLGGLLAAALDEDDAVGVVRWSDRMISAYREVDEPQIISTLVRLRNRCSELSAD